MDSFAEEVLVHVPFFPTTRRPRHAIVTSGGEELGLTPNWDFRLNPKTYPIVEVVIRGGQGGRLCISLV